MHGKILSVDHTCGASELPLALGSPVRERKVQFCLKENNAPSAPVTSSPSSRVSSVSPSFPAKEEALYKVNTVKKEKPVLYTPPSLPLHGSQASVSDCATDSPSPPVPMTKVSPESVSVSVQDSLPQHISSSVRDFIGTCFRRVFVSEPRQAPVDPDSSVLRQGTKPLRQYLMSKIKVVHDALGQPSPSEPPLSETHDLVWKPPDKSENVLEVFKTKAYKPKPEGSKLVTRDDGSLYQEVAHFATRSSLYVPRDTSNFMGASAYTGERITEGVYNSGEKFTDTTPWYPSGAPSERWKRDREQRSMKERWQGKTFLRLKDDDDETLQKASTQSQALTLSRCEPKASVSSEKSSSSSCSKSAIVRNSLVYRLPPPHLKIPLSQIWRRVTKHVATGEVIKDERIDPKKTKTQLTDLLPMGPCDVETTWYFGEVLSDVSDDDFDDDAVASSSEDESDSSSAMTALIADCHRLSGTQHRLKKRHQHSIVEICTYTQNITSEAIKLGWKGLTPITIETGYDLYTSSGRKEAWRQLMADRPDVIVGEWPCSPHSSLNNLNAARSPELAQDVLDKQQQILPLIRWIARVEKWQTDRGKIFIAEQPGNCGSWNLSCLQDMQKRNYSTFLDMCQFGLKDPYNQKPYRHRTKLCHNSRAVHEAMRKLCPGKHEHQVTKGTTHYRDESGDWKSIPRSTFAGWYTPRFCQSLLSALAEEFRARRATRVRQVSHPVNPVDDLSAKSLRKELPGTWTCEVPGCGKVYSDESAMLKHLRTCNDEEHKKFHREKQLRKQRIREENAAKRRRVQSSSSTSPPASVAKENNASASASSSSGSSAPPAVVPSETGQREPLQSAPGEGSVMTPPGSAPLMDMSRSHTDIEAQQHGFESAAEWQQRTTEAESLGLTSIRLTPHESQRLLRPPESATSLPSAGEPVTIAPPEPLPSGAEVRLQSDSIPTLPERPSNIPPVRRMPKVPKRMAGKIPVIQRGRARPFAGSLERARRMLGMSQSTAPPVEAGSLPVGDAQAGTASMPIPQAAPQVHGPSAPDESDLGPVAVSRAPAPAPSASVGVPQRAGDLVGYPHDLSSWLNCEDHPGHDPTGDIQYEELDMPPEARNLPEKMKKVVRNAHRNLGHPGNYALVRLMKTAKCPRELITYARYMKCPVCARKQAPARIPTATMPYRPTRFNAVVGLDLKEIHDYSKKRYYCLNILDLATCFNILIPLPDKSSKTVAQAFRWAWLNWAGVPEKIVCDSGTEFYKSFTSEVLENLGIKSRFIPTEAQWQNGMVERHGQVMGDIVSSVIKETRAVGIESLKEICLHSSMAKNRRPGKTGYSARAMVFGVDERLVLSGLNHFLEEPDDAALANATGDEKVKQSMRFRTEAMKAVIEMDHMTKWSEAIKTPSRPLDVQLFLPGHQVAFWRSHIYRKHKARGVKHLPERWRMGVVIGHEWDGEHMTDAYWISSHGRCFLVPGQHMRHAEMREVLDHEQMLRSAVDTLRNLQQDPGNFTWYDYRRPANDNEAEPPGEYRQSANADSVGEEEASQDIPSRRRGRDESGIYDSNEPDDDELFPSDDLDRRVAPRLSTSTSSHVPAASSSAGLIHPSEALERASTATGGLADDGRDDERSEMQYSPHSPASTPSVGPNTGVDAADATRLVRETANLLDGLPQEALSMRNQESFVLRHKKQVLVADHDTHEVFFLKWKTFKKNQKKGRELDPRYFDAKEKTAFDASDAKEWKSFIDTGAVRIIPPSVAKTIPSDRIFKRAARYVRTNKDKTGDTLQAKSRIVVPGDVDPDGETPVEEGGFRTDAPTCPQIGLHLLFSYAVRRKWRLKTFDVSTAFLSGKHHNREIYMRPPPEGLPGVPPGSLLQIVKGAYGLREAPRLWYLKAREVIRQAGWEELRTARACFVLRDKTKEDAPLCGMMVLHVDDACYGGEGAYYDSVMKDVLQQFKIGSEKTKSFDFLGRHVEQFDDYHIEVDQHSYVSQLQKCSIPKARRMTPKAKLNADELSSYRSIVGQLAWPARETMPQLSYAVSDLQQRTAEATVHDLCHANNVLGLAKRWASEDKQKLKFLPLSGDAAVDCVYHEQSAKTRKQKDQSRRIRLGIGAIHDASFMQQLNQGSQYGYAIMLAPVTLYDEPTTTHLLDWNSAKIHRKVRSTLAAEAAGASRAYDRSAFVRAMIHEIESGEHLHWTDAVKKIPFGLGTDCKSLYDVCSKLGSMPDERRVALDLLDVKEGVEEFHDVVRWVPTDHMLADGLTKSMPPDLLMKYLKDYRYSFKYDEEIKNTKREIAKERKAVREQKQSTSPLPPTKNTSSIPVKTKPSSNKIHATPPFPPSTRITGKQPFPPTTRVKI